MGEDSASEQLVSELPLLWIVVGMAILASLAGLFTFCVRRKRTDSVGQRKKTDEPTPDDKGLEPQTRENAREGEPQETVAETPSARVGETVAEAELARVEREQVAEGSEEGKGEDAGVVGASVVAQGGDSESEHREEVAPVISEHNEEEAVHTEVVSSEVSEPVRNGDVQTPSGGGVETEEGERDGEERAGEETGVADEQAPPRPPDQVDQTDNVEPSTLTNGTVNGHAEQDTNLLNTRSAMVNGQGSRGQGRGNRFRWSFPPELEEFDLMDTDADPNELEQMFSDERITELYLNIEPDSPGLGISIVGGSGSPSGDLPIIVKRVLPGSLAEMDGRLKTGDELVAVNDTLLVGARKDKAIETLSNMKGEVRLLVLQDD